MKALKVLGIIILIAIAVYFIVPLFLADNVIVTDSTTIKAKPETIFRQVNSLEKWLAWSPFEADTTIVNQFSGPERGVGAKRTWDGEEAGLGSITVKTSEPYKFIQNDLSFGPEGGGIGSWNFNETEEGTEVIWTIQVTELTYPNQKWIGLFIEVGLKPMLTNGLADLKKLTESMPRPPEIKIIETDKITSLVIPDSATMSGMKAMFEKNYGELMEFVKRRKVPITGQQFAIYHNWNPEGYTRVSVGVPVGTMVKDYKRIKYYEIPAGKAVFAKHTGGYNTGNTHWAIDDYLKDFNIETKKFIWETYAYHPERDADSTKWVTFIYYPIK